MGDPAIGLFSQFVVDYENGWGTDKGSPAGFMVAMRPGSGMKPTQARTPNETFRGDYNKNVPFLDKIDAAGKLSMYPTIKTLPWFIKWQTGGLTTTGSADPWAHTTKTTNVTPLSAVVQHSIGLATTEYWKFNGVRVNTMTIPFGPVGGLALDFDVKGKVGAVSTTNYNASPTDWRVGAPLDQLMLAAADVKIDGSAVGYIASGTITVNNNLGADDYRSGGAATRGSLVPSDSQSVEVSMRLCMDSSAVRTLIQQQTPIALDLKWIAQASPSHFFRIEIPVLYLGRDGVIPDSGAVMADVKGMAAFDATVASQIRYSFQNDQAGTVYV